MVFYHRKYFIHSGYGWALDWNHFFTQYFLFLPEKSWPYGILATRNDAEQFPMVDSSHGRMFHSPGDLVFKTIRFFISKEFFPHSVRIHRVTPYCIDSY